MSIPGAECELAESADALLNVAAVQFAVAMDRTWAFVLFRVGEIDQINELLNRLRVSRCSLIRGLQIRLCERSNRLFSTILVGVVGKLTETSLP